MRYDKCSNGLKITNSAIKYIAFYYLIKQCTMSCLVEKFGVPKTSLHRYFNERLKTIDKNMYNKVQIQMKFNIQESKFKKQNKV